jgi:hypothetical protein
MDNPSAFIASLAGEDLFFMGDEERGVGWSAIDGWVDPSNDIVDLYTQKQIDGGRIRPPSIPGNWKWTKFNG